MQTVQKIAQGMDTIAALNAVLRQPQLFNGEKMVLRDKTPEGDFANWINFDLMSQLRPYVFGLMSRFEGEKLEQVVVYQLEQGQELSIPQPGGGKANFILVLGAFAGATAKQFPLAAGDAWWLGEETVVGNNSGGDLVFMLVTLVPSGPATYIPEVSA